MSIQIQNKKINKSSQEGNEIKMNITKIIAEELNVKTSQVDSAVKLIDEGNTIPFIARYRKEATGGLSDEQLRNLGERLTYLRNLETRKQEVATSIEGQGKLTDEIVIALEMAKTLSEVEDIYRPYKQKKRTRATIAKEKRARTACKYHLFTKGKRANRKYSRKICKCRKRSKNS